jgi:hypothetical protein
LSDRASCDVTVGRSDRTSRSSSRTWVGRLRLFDMDERKTFSSAEHRHIAERMDSARAELRQTEARPAAFVAQRRHFTTSPAFRFELARLSRDLLIRGQRRIYREGHLDGAGESRKHCVRLSSPSSKGSRFRATDVESMLRFFHLTSIFASRSGYRFRGLSARPRRYPDARNSRSSCP